MASCLDATIRCDVLYFDMPEQAFSSELPLQVLYFEMAAQFKCTNFAQKYAETHVRQWALSRMIG